MKIEADIEDGEPFYVLHASGEGHANVLALLGERAMNGAGFDEAGDTMYEQGSLLISTARQMRAWSAAKAEAEAETAKEEIAETPRQA